ITQAPPRFLAGQEAAVVNRLGGGPALPTFQPPRVTERGLRGAPTLVQNVETLAHIALIARYGPRWFRSVGTAAEPGSMLTTIYDTNGKRQVMEAGIGTPLRSLPNSGAETQARPGSPSWPDAGTASRSVPTSSAGPGWSPAAAPAITPTAPCGSSAAP